MSDRPGAYQRQQSGAAAGSPASTCSARPGTGTRSPPTWSRPGWTRPPALAFFTAAEAACAAALLNLLTGQQDDQEIPVLEMVDARLAAGETDGWRYSDMPEDGQAWRDTLAYLDADADARCGTTFAAAPEAQQLELIQAVQDLGSKDWHGLNAAHVWSLWTRYACTALYAHPLAWNEIGFSGPAYPRGYKNAGVGKREPFEVTRRPAVRRPDPGRSLMPGVRDRNESAWLLPNDGTRTNHRLRAGHAAVRRHRRDRPGHRGLRRGRLGAAAAAGPGRLAGGGPGRGPVLGPGHGLGQRRGGLAPAVLDRAAGDQRDRSGADGLEQLRPRGRRLDGALRGVHAAVPPERLRDPAPATAWVPTGRWPTRTCARTTSRSSRNSRSPGSTGRGATRTATRTGRIRWAATARSSCAGPASWASRPGSGRWPSPTAGSATGRTASTAASACRAARSTPRRRR